MYFKKFCDERNIQEETVKGYRTTINHYSNYYNLHLDDLINEAIDEENDPTIKKRQRSIKNRLLQFRTHLANDTTLKHSTIAAHMRHLTTIYTHFDVELPNLPPFQHEDKIETTYFDLPTKKQIGMAVDIAGIRVGSLILFMASSGTGRTECANMTVGDYINACAEYYTSESLPEILEEIYSSVDPVVPTFFLYRQKTKKNYYTFCTPEAAHAIAEWLLLRLRICESKGEELGYEDSLWDFTTRQITYHFNIVNDELKFGFKGSYRFFRPHTLRKFHASNIGLSQENIDLLQGRSREIVHATYIKTNPAQFKQVYMNAMDNVTIGKSNKEIKHEEFTININLNFYGYDYSVTL